MAPQMISCKLNKKRKVARLIVSGLSITSLLRSCSSRSHAKLPVELCVTLMARVVAKETNVLLAGYKSIMKQQQTYHEEINLLVLVTAGDMDCSFGYCLQNAKITLSISSEGKRKLKRLQDGLQSLHNHPAAPRPFEIRTAGTALFIRTTAVYTTD